EIGEPFYLGLSRRDNLSEVVLLEAFLAQAMALATGTDLEIETLLREIVPSPEARQLHAFAPQDFRDHVRGAVTRKIDLTTPHSV
ncbi:hypothetical protein DUP91_27210, partial [Salmonella enterica subsp. enterica]|nr:hypothetical protein [Salmonella enterica subsp. enterica]